MCSDFFEETFFEEHDEKEEMKKGEEQHRPQ